MANPCREWIPVYAQPRIVGLDAGFDSWINPMSYFFYVPGGADDNLIEGGEMKFVCKPGARNITVIFQPLLRYSNTSEHTGSKQNAANETDENVVLRGGLLALWNVILLPSKQQINHGHLTH